MQRQALQDPAQYYSTARTLVTSAPIVIHIVGLVESTAHDAEYDTFLGSVDDQPIPTHYIPTSPPPQECAIAISLQLGTCKVELPRDVTCPFYRWSNLHGSLQSPTVARSRSVTSTISAFVDVQFLKHYLWSLMATSLPQMY